MNNAAMNQASINLSGKKVAVVGMKLSGTAAVKLLLSEGAEVRAIDQTETGQVLGIPIEPQVDASFRDAELIVISPGVPAQAEVLERARARGIKVIGELELAAWFLQGNIIGITGSNGKTTTTALTGHILRECGIPCQVGGNIGTPPTALIETSRPDQWNVLELSSFQLETIETFRAHIGIALNVTDNHLDRHGTFANYAAAKARLFETQQPGDYAILNADNPTTASYARLTRGHVLWFGSKNIHAGRIEIGGRPLMDTRDIPLRGRHNWENVMAAAMAAQVAGAKLEAIAAAVRTFPGVEHRLEWVRTAGGVTYYNDSKATSVDATLKAIDAFPGGLWIILGGKDKNSDYTVLREPLRRKARAALLVGAAAPKIAAQLEGALPLIECGTIQVAVQCAARDASAGDTVLLAPACASFDQFRSFEERGEVFKQLIKALPGRGEEENGSAS